MKKIMISYGRADASEFAYELKSSLEDKDYDVWLDKEEIKGGYEWEEQIENAIEESDIVISILTPHAIRRSNGVCLDEISMARFKSKLIIPIMYKNIEPPLCIFRLDWIDFLKYESQKSKETIGKEKLFKSIEEGKIAYEGKNTQFKALKSINFDARLTALKRDFIGRKWIFDAKEPNNDSLINQWLESDKNIMLILGNPGIGKSAISAYLIEKHPACVAYHFCIAKDEDTLNPSKFIKSIAHQLTSQIGDEYGDLILNELDDGLPSCPLSLFRTLISNPISQLNLDEVKFILIDGLDEASKFNADNELLELISVDFIEALPRNIRFIFTSRNDRAINSRFEVYNPFNIETSDDRNIEDMKNYISHMLEKHKIEKLSSNEVDNLIYKSEGNILYLKQIFKNSGNKIDVDNLPKGLYGIYDAYFKNTFGRNEYEGYKEIFSILISVYTPITVNLLEIILNEEGIENSKLKKIEAYFPINSNDIITVFHKSFLDWLKESSTYSVEEITGHRKIIDTDRLDLKNQDELHIYLYSATKVFIYKQTKRHKDIDDFFDAKIKDILSNLDNSSSSGKLKKELLTLMSLDTEYNKKYRDILNDISVDNKSDNVIFDLGVLFKENPEKWASDYILTLGKLAFTYPKQNKLEELIALQEELRHIIIDLFNKNKEKWAEDYINSLNNLTITYSMTHQIDKAIAINEEGVNILQSLYIENPSKWVKLYTTTLNTLASAYLYQNSNLKAIRIQEKSLQILHSLYQDVPERWIEDYLRALNNLAIAYFNNNQLDKAITLEESAQKILKLLYKDNPVRWEDDYLRTLNNLAEHYRR